MKLSYGPIIVHASFHCRGGHGLFGADAAPYHPQGRWRPANWSSEDVWFEVGKSAPTAEDFARHAPVPRQAAAGGDREKRSRSDSEDDSGSDGENGQGTGGQGASSERPNKRRRRCVERSLPFTGLQSWKACECRCRDADDSAAVASDLPAPRVASEPVIDLTMDSDDDDPPPQPPRRQPPPQHQPPRRQQPPPQQQRPLPAAVRVAPTSAAGAMRHRTGVSAAAYTPDLSADEMRLLGELLQTMPDAGQPLGYRHPQMAAGLQQAQQQPGTTGARPPLPPPPAAGGNSQGSGGPGAQGGLLMRLGRGLHYNQAPAPQSRSSGESQRTGSQPSQGSGPPARPPVPRAPPSMSFQRTVMSASAPPYVPPAAPTAPYAAAAAPMPGPPWQRQVPTLPGTWGYPPFQTGGPRPPTWPPQNPPPANGSGGG